MLLIKCWLIWFCLEPLQCLNNILQQSYVTFRKKYRDSVTCVSEIYMAPSQWNKQSKEMHSALVGPFTWENLFSSEDNKFLEGYQIENSAVQNCVLVGVVAALGIRLCPSGDQSLDTDSNTFIMQQALLVAVLSFPIFILDTFCSSHLANWKILSWPETRLESLAHETTKHWN